MITVSVKKKMFVSLRTKKEITRAFHKAKYTRTNFEKVLDDDMRLGFFIMIVATIVLTFMAFRFTQAFLSDNATSTNNTFSAATEFPVGVGTTSPPSQTVVINEIMWMGSSEQGIDDEWIELRNTTAGIIDISNWFIEGLGVGLGSITLGVGSTIPAGGFFVIADDLQADSILNFEPSLQTSSVSLDNDGEQLILKNASLFIIDIVDTVGGGWLAGDNGTVKKSMERNSIPGDGTLVGSWHTASAQSNLDIGTTSIATPLSVNSL